MGSGKAWSGWVRQGEGNSKMRRRDVNGFGDKLLRCGMGRLGMAWHGKAWSGMEGLGEAWHGPARRGKPRSGKVR